MNADRRDAVEAALREARQTAYPPGQHVEQESFMLGMEILELAHRAGVAPGTSVLDLCCGVAGPGRLIARRLRCDYLGVDESACAIEIARRRARGLPCRFLIARVPPLPPGRFDVVLLLETMLAFPDKRPLIAQVAEALVPGGRFAFTLEAGEPLTAAERAAMPNAGTVWPTPVDEVRAMALDAGLAIRWEADLTDSHAATARALHDAFAADAERIEARLGRRALDDLRAAHRLWAAWLAAGRVRKVAVVAERS